MNKAYAKLHGIYFLAGVAVLLTAASPTASAPKSSVSGEEQVCIEPSVEAAMMQCPSDIKMKRFGKVPSSGVKAVERKLPEKKSGQDEGPGIGQDFRKSLLDSVFTKKREKKKIDLLKQEISLLERLSGQTQDKNPEKAEILARLANSYSEFNTTLNFMAREMDQKIFEAGKAGQKKQVATMKAQQKKLLDMGREKRELAIKTWVQIKNSFPDYPNYDEVLFSIAHEIDQLASEFDEKEKAKRATYRERARVFYQELIRNYPRSRFIPFAWMAFGDYHFNETKDVERAMRSYQKVVEWGKDDNPQYVVALYYQAWCLINMQEHQKAIDQFLDVIKFAEASQENREAQAVAKRARIELVSPYARIGKPTQAWQFFERVGGSQSHDMLRRLADLYYGDGHWAEAIVVLHKLQALELENYKKNNGDDLCEYQYMVTQAVISSKPKNDQLVELKRLLSLYKKFATENHDPAKVASCAQKTTSLAWDQATHWHVEAVGSDAAPGTKDRNTMEVCIGLYDEILATFPNLDTLTIDGFDENTRPTNYRVAYYRAELLWNMEDWKRCGPAFDYVVELDPNGNYVSEAAYAAVLCYNKVYTTERSDDKSRKHKLVATAEGPGGSCESKECKACRKKCKGKAECLSACQDAKQVVAPRELTELEKGILNSYERYVCFAKEGGDLANIKYRRARIYYEANKFAEAAVLFKDVAINNSDDEVGVYAANLYLDCLNALGSMVAEPIPSCYDALAEVVDTFIDETKDPGKNLMKDQEFATQLKTLKVGVMRKKAESLKDRGRYIESAEIYLSIYRNYQGIYDDNGMCEVLYNTAIMMEAANLVMRAIKVRERMVELYPNCEYSKKAAYFIGANYHAMQFFQQAADNYKTFAAKWSGEDEAPDALANATVFYIGLGQYDQAWDAVKLFEKNYRGRQPQKAASVFFSAGNIYIKDATENNNDKAWDDARRHYNAYLKNYSRVKAVDEQVQAWVFIGDSYWNKRKPDYSGAEKAYKKALDIFDAKAMDQVEDNTRKASMLIAAAKARYQIAELKFLEFRNISFPEFKAEREVPAKIQKAWEKEKGKEEVAKVQEVRKYRRLLARWGEMTQEEVRKEERKEAGQIQFDFWLKEKFAPWLEKKSKVLQDATGLFGKVADMHVPEWEMAAAARAADMQLEFMQSLYDAPLPPAFKDDQELIDIYRGEMDNRADSYRATATQLYDHCLNISTKVRWFNENSLRCEKELNKLDPRKYPVSEEIRTHPDNELSRWAEPSPLLELETAVQRRQRELAMAEESGGKAQ
jgi:hypothetical protein